MCWDVMGCGGLWGGCVGVMWCVGVGVDGGVVGVMGVVGVGVDVWDVWVWMGVGGVDVVGCGVCGGCGCGCGVV